MITKDKVSYILDSIEHLYPNASCELNYNNIYELSIAVILSAQTTDAAVNKITPILFLKYPNVQSLSNASLQDVMDIIHPLGLYKNKSKAIINFARGVVEKYNSIIPNTLEELLALDGIGRKCANVILAEGFKIPAMPVDTHVDRVTKRMGIVDVNNTVYQTEMDLNKLIDKERLHKAHHLFIHFGRYFCKSKNPLCENCFYSKECLYKNQK